MGSRDPLWLLALVLAPLLIPVMLGQIVWERMIRPRLLAAAPRSRIPRGRSRPRRRAGH